MQHASIVQAICGTEVPMLVVHDLSHQAREHAAWVPDGADEIIAERRALVALAISYVARQQWSPLLAAAHSDEMLVHDQVSVLAMACDWLAIGDEPEQLVRITPNIMVAAHWHRRLPAAQWSDPAERAFLAACAEISDETEEDFRQAVAALRVACQPHLPAESLALLDQYVWLDGEVMCCRPVKNIGGYLHRSIVHAAGAQQRQAARESADPEWLDTAPSVARQEGFFAELGDAMRSLPESPVHWERDAAAWLLQGDLVYREQRDQAALQREYLGDPSAMADLEPAQALQAVADGLAQAYHDLWFEDPLLAMHLRPAKEGAWRRRPSKETAAQVEKFSVWGLEIILRHHVSTSTLDTAALVPNLTCDASCQQVITTLGSCSQDDWQPELAMVQELGRKVWQAAALAVEQAPPETDQLQRHAASLLGIPPEKSSTYRVRLLRSGEALRATHEAGHPRYAQFLAGH